MRYEVTLRGPRGESEIVHLEAADGDEAAAKAFKAHRIILGVHPSPVKPRARKAS